MTYRESELSMLTHYSKVKEDVKGDNFLKSNLDLIGKMGRGLPTTQVFMTFSVQVYD